MNSGLRKSVLAIVAVPLCGAAFAKEFPGEGGVPDEQGRWDLTSVGSWAGDVPLGSSVEVTGEVSVVVTASKDATFGKLTNQIRTWWNDQLTFDMAGYSPTRVLKFDGFDFGSANGRYVHTTFKGGEWDFGNGDFCNGTACWGDFKTLRITEGAVVTNARDMVLGYTDQEALRAEIVDGSQLWLNGNFMFTDAKLSMGNENVLMVSDGSHLDIGGELKWEGDYLWDWEKSCAYQYDGHFYYKDYVLVSNATMDVHGAYSRLGVKGGNATIVTHGGKLTFHADLILWADYARNNLIRVENGGSLLLKGGANYGGWNAAPHEGLNYNRMEVLSGSSVVSDGPFYLGFGNNCGNTLVISNATFSAKKFDLSWDSSISNQTVLIQGADAKFDVNADDANWPMFGKDAPNNRIIVDDCATFVTRDSFARYEAACHDCSLIARRGGTLKHEGTFVVGLQNLTPGYVATSNNVLIAESSGKIEMGGVMVLGGNSGLRVDDGDVCLTDSGVGIPSLWLGRTWDYGGIGTNCYLTISGSKPSIVLADGLELENGSKIRYELPADGYDPGVVPLKIGGSVDWGDGCSLEFVGSAAMYESHLKRDERAKYVLAEGPEGAAFIPDDVIASAAEQLQGRFRLRKVTEDGKNRLVLAVRVPRGLSVTIR